MALHRAVNQVANESAAHKGLISLPTDRPRKAIQDKMAAKGGGCGAGAHPGLQNRVRGLDKVPGEFDSLTPPPII